MAPPRLLLAAASALALSCHRPPDPPTDGGAAANPPPAPAPAAGEARRRQADALTLSLDAPETAAAGDSVPIRLRLTNGGADPVTLTLTAPVPFFDVVATAPDGSEAWRWLAGKGIPGGGQTRMLAPGESLSMNAVWPRTLDARSGRPARPGAYRLRGRLTFSADDAPHAIESGPRTITLLPSR